MLQKIINGIAIASGVVSITVVGAVGVVYLNKDAIIENVKSKVMESVLPSGLGGGVGVDGDGSPKPPPKSPRPPSLSVTASITLPLTFSIIASLLRYTTPTAPTTVIDTTPLAIAIPLIIFCNMINLPVKFQKIYVFHEVLQSFFV